MNNNFKVSLLFIFFIFGCIQTHSGVVLESDKSYISFQCSSNSTYNIFVNDNISFVVDENNCSDLFQIPIGKNRVTVSTMNNEKIIIRDIFTSNGTTIKIDLP